MAEKKLREL